MDFGPSYAKTESIRPLAENGQASQSGSLETLFNTLADFTFTLPPFSCIIALVIKIEQRKIYLYFIYPFATLFFIALSFCFIMSARGYLVVFDNGIKFEKTGMIIGSTNPPGAKIFLNGKDISKATIPFLSTKINNLKKGKYILDYEKDGFYTWQKELLVSPERVTWANYALLFSKNPKIEKTKIGGKLLGSLNSKDNKYSIFLVQNADNQIIYLVNNSDDSKDDVFETAKMKPEERISGVTLIAWSDDHENLLVKGMLGAVEQYYVINTSDKTSENVTGLLPAGFSSPMFNPANGDELYFALNGQVLRVNVPAKTSQAFSEKGILYFSVEKNGNIYYIKDNAGARSLWQANGDFSNPSAITDGIPASENYSLTVSSQGQKMALQTKEGALYLIDNIDGKEMLIVMGKNISEFSWSPDGDRLLYKNGPDVKVFEFVDYKKESREYQIPNGADLRDFAWYDNDHLLAETLNNKAEVMDFDGQNKIDLAAITPGSKVFFSSDNHNISFISKSDADKFALSRYITEF